MKDVIIEGVRRAITDAKAAHARFGVGFPKASIDCNILERICILAEEGMQLYREKLDARIEKERS